jgi:hypothetical protein
MKKFIFGFMIIVSMGFIMGCSDAEVASQNVSKAADQFEVYRRVVFYNGITDTYILMVEGYCSVLRDSDGDVNILIKTGPGTYLKHMLSPSDNVTWFSEQIESANVSTGKYRVIFKPSTLIPDIDLH